MSVAHREASQKAHTVKGVSKSLQRVVRSTQRRVSVSWHGQGSMSEGTHREGEVHREGGQTKASGKVSEAHRELEGASSWHGQRRVPVAGMDREGCQKVHTDKGRCAEKGVSECLQKGVRSA